MAELLVRVVDKINPEFYANTKCTKKGDVIVAKPDGWPWGVLELTAPQYRILRHSQLPLAEAEALCAPEVDMDPLHPSRTLQRRRSWLNLFKAAYPVTLKNWLADSTRAVPILDVTLVFFLAEFRAIKEQKAPIVDPGVVG